MENDGRKSNDSDTAEGLFPTPDVPNQKAKKPNKSGRASQKPNGEKKKSYRKSWRSASPLSKIGLIFAGIAAIAAAGYLLVTILGILQTKRHFEIEHAPLLIHNVPPKFLQKYKCTVASRHKKVPGVFPTGDFQVGNIDITYKNIGNDTAYNAGGGIFDFGLVFPAKRTGIPVLDEGLKVNQSDCVPRAGLGGAPLEPGIERTIMGLLGASTVPPQVKDGDSVIFEFKACITYADRRGSPHQTCDLYSLFTHDIPNLRVAEQIHGTDKLPCDGIERTGEFVPMNQHCQQ